MKVIIFDFEVFKYDTLFGALIVSKDNEPELYQTWNLNDIKEFYNLHKYDLWIGHNNINYDNIILEAIINNKNPFVVNKQILKSEFRKKSNIPYLTYDLMNNDFYSLKTTEAAVGKNISESDVDFEIDRPLTDNEKSQTESYNRDDLNQTYYNYNSPTLKGTLSTRWDVIKEFKLNPIYLCATETKLAELVFGAKQIEGIENQKIKPHLYDTLILKNQQLKDFYLREGFRHKETEIIHVCGADIKIGAGGAHSAIKNYHSDKFLYFDVSGYYNLVMLNYDLLPRTMPTEAKELYRTLYFKQLEYKKTNPKKRASLKVVLLAVFGAMTNKYTAFYDPEKGTLVTVTGILFICDLLEKLEGYITVIQTNTDGIMVEPLDWNNYDKIIEIVEDWEKRTGFVIKKELRYNLWQRDVNNYFFVEPNGKVYTKGEAVRTYNCYNDIFERRTFDSKEPLIVAKCLVDYLLYNKSPEETVEENKNNFILFQYICKRNSFDYLTCNNERLQHINRVFASNDYENVKMIYKHKNNRIEKYSNLPDNIFVFNDDLSKLTNKYINYNYYVKRAYERISEFKYGKKEYDFDYIPLL